tara:strand:+ start:3316 stop:3498 length:183 start_codon:yes stop_codon:yes gene_type:complete
MKKFNLLIFAIIGSLCAFTMIDLFIVKISMLEFIIIELIITFSHALYTIAKKDLLKPKDV